MIRVPEMEQRHPKCRCRIDPGPRPLKTGLVLGTEPLSGAAPVVSREPRIPYLINRKTRLKPGEQNERIVRAPPNFQSSKRLRSRQVAPRHGGKTWRALQNGKGGRLQGSPPVTSQPGPASAASPATAPRTCRAAGGRAFRGGRWGRGRWTAGRRSRRGLGCRGGFFR